MIRFLKFMLSQVIWLWNDQSGQLPGEVGGISYRWDLFEDAPTLVKSRFDDMKNFGLQGFNMAMASIQALSNIAGQLQLINRVITIDTEPITEPPLTEIPPTIDMTQFRVDYPAEPNEPSLIDATLESIPGVFPDMLGPGDIDPGQLGAYSDSLMSALQKKLLNDLITGSVGITPDVEDAIFKREYERSLLEYEDEQDRIAANWAKGSFPFPNSALRAAQTKAAREFSNKRLDVSRDIAIKSFELALQNTHFIIQQGIGLEAQLIQWADRVATRVFEASKAVIDTNIRTYDARVKGFGERARIIIEKCRAKIEYNIGLIRLYEGRVNAFASKMRAESERINAVARGYEAETAVFKSVVDFDVERISLDLKVIQARIDQASVNAQILIKDKEIELKNYEMLNSLKVEALKSEGMIAAQVASGALAAVHAQVHIGAQDVATYTYTPRLASTSTQTSTDAKGNTSTTTTTTSGG